MAKELCGKCGEIINATRACACQRAVLQEETRRAQEAEAERLRQHEAKREERRRNRTAEPIYVRDIPLRNDEFWICDKCGCTPFAHGCQKDECRKPASEEAADAFIAIGEQLDKIAALYGLRRGEAETDQELRGKVLDEMNFIAGKSPRANTWVCVDWGFGDEVTTYTPPPNCRCTIPELDHALDAMRYNLIYALGYGTANRPITYDPPKIEKPQLLLTDGETK